MLRGSAGTDHEEIGLDRAVLDVHGACTMGRWSGGRAGDYFEAGFNSFLTKRTPMVNVRATMLDDTTGFEPFVETYTSEKVPWATTAAA